jgi:hypothetical protein
MTDNNPPKQQAQWWTLPKVVVIAIGGGLAFAAALITNGTTIINWLGYGPRPLHISLSILDIVTPEGLHDTRYYRYTVIADVTKTGDGVLRDCAFSAYIGSLDVPISHGTSELSLPDGPFMQGFGLTMDAPANPELSDGLATITLVCDKASSKPILFHFPPVPDHPEPIPDSIFAPRQKN